MPQFVEILALRVGIGHDTHRLVEGRPLILGGSPDRPPARSGRALRRRRRLPCRRRRPAGRGGAGRHRRALPGHRPRDGRGSTAPGCWPRSSTGRAGGLEARQLRRDRPRPGAQARAAQGGHARQPGPAARARRAASTSRPRPASTSGPSAGARRSAARPSC